MTPIARSDEHIFFMTGISDCSWQNPCRTLENQWYLKDDKCRQQSIDFTTSECSATRARAMEQPHGWAGERARKVPERDGTRGGKGKGQTAVSGKWKVQYFII